MEAQEGRDDMNVGKWLLFWMLLEVLAVLLGCTPTEPPDASATEPSSDDPSPMSFPSPPSTGDSEAVPTSTGSTGDGTTAVATTATTGSTGVDPYCGDDKVDPWEECDLGRDNSDSGVCTLLCKNATCGDGHVFEGFEECDLGDLNLGYYGGCTKECTLASHCGDGVVDPLFEECDLADLNGAGVGMGDEPPCESGCNWQARLVFISSLSYSGDLGGVAGADEKCRALADAADLPDPESFRAWLSDGSESPNSRFQGIAVADRPYVLLSGKIVAESYVDLTQNGPHTGIAITETGETVFDEFVWTNTSPFGDQVSFNDHCGGWDSASALGVARVGYNALAVEFGPDFQAWKQQRYWTSFLDDQCHKLYRLYCFEDAPAEG